MSMENLKRDVGANLFDLVAENKALFTRIGKLLATDLEFGVAQIGKELGIDTFSVNPLDAINFMNSRQNAMAEVNRNTFNSVMSELQDGLNAGESYQQAADRVKAVYRHASDARAETIAVTETNMAINAGRFSGMKRAGVDLKGWATSTLENVRPAHQAAGAKYKDGIPLDQPFIVGGEPLMYPGDENGSPGNVINCRCFTFAILANKAGLPTTHQSLLTFDEFMGRKNAPGGLQGDLSGQGATTPQPKEES